METLENYALHFRSHVLRFTFYALSLFHIGCGLIQIGPGEEKSTVLEEAVITQAAAEQALVSDNVRCVSTSTGHVWVGTDRGVSVYHKADNRWTKLDREDGLLSDDVTAIAADGESVWIGTTLGVSLYDLEDKRWIKFQRRDGLASNKVTAIAVDGNYIWVGTDAGISRYDKTTGAWALQREKDKDQFNAITAIAVESEYVWFGTEDGLRRYDKPKDAWNVYTKEEGLVENHIRHIALSPDAVWVGTEKSGVSKYSTINQTFTESHTRTDRIESDFIRAIAVDGDNVWFGSADRGIRRYIATVDTWFKYTTTQGLVSDHIAALTVDGRNIWIGTYEHGLGRYDKATDGWTWYSRRDALASNQVQSLVSTEGALWAGTNKGLSRYALREKTWRNYTKADGLTTNYITSLTAGAEDGSLWVGTPLGLGRLAGKRWRFYTERNGLAHNFVTCVSVSNQIWVGTKGGLNVLMEEPPISSLQSGIETVSESTNQQNWSMETPSIPDSSHRTFHASRSYLTGKWVTAVLVINKEVWAGTTEGVYRRNAATDRFELFPVVTDYVNTLVFSPDGRLLVGTRNGLWIIHGETSTHIINGLPNPNVRAIAVDKETIWIGTPGGVARTDGARVQQIVTMQPDGLLHNNVQSITVVDKQVFFGTVAGLAVYEVENDRWDRHKPYHDTEVLREDEARWIELDGHHLWVISWSASPNGAILKFDRRTDTWIEYTKDALPLSSEIPFITGIRRLAVGTEDVWCATGDGGVLRYNKASDTWMHFTKSSGLPGHHATLIELDEPDRVWVAFLGGVAAHYDMRTEKWETVKVTEAGIGTYIEDIACTKDYVWFSTRSVGVKRYERATKTWRSYTEAQGMASRSGDWIATDGEGVWTSGEGHYSWVRDRRVHGVSYYRPDDDTWTIYDRREGLRADRTDYGQVGEDYVWCFGRSGINRYDKAGKSWTSFTRSDGLPGSGVEAIAEDGDGFWVGTVNKGVLKYAQASGAWTAFTVEDGLVHDSVWRYQLKVDSKYVWVGTSRGLSRYDKEKETWTSFTKPTTLADRRAVAVATDSRHVWVGTHRGLSRYDKRYDRWKHFQKSEEERDEEDNEEEEDEEDGEKEEKNELVDNNVIDLSVGRRYVWIATEGGVGRYDKIADRFESYTKENQLPSVDIRAVVQNRSDVWVGTKNGISKHSILSDDRNAWETYNAAIEILPTVEGKYAKSLKNDDVRCLAVDENRVWAGTKTGVSVYALRQGTWTTFTQNDGLASDEVSCIIVDNEQVWFGSGRGVTVYDTLNETWKVLTEADGLGSNLITSMAIRGDQVWFGTFDKGVTMLDKTTGQFTTFTKAEGLPHNGILSIAIDGDYLWFGTHGGLTRYDSLTGTWTVYTEWFDHDGI